MRITRPLVALPVTLLLAVTLGGTPAVADPPSPPGTKASPTGKEHRAERAEQALAAVQAILDGRGSHRGGDAHEGGRPLTLALRDLALLKDALPAAEQRTAERALSRPAATKRSCTPNICVHYTRSGVHAPSLRDRNNNNVPDYIDSVRKTVNGIHVKYKQAGYRSPLPDRRKGGDDRTDIYIRDIGANGIYGYCTTDDPRQRYDRWAYCVLDDNYSRDEFPTNTPLENMKVTAAHEYFHAVQFAYDFAEDGWILESTAAWVEDEMFDGVDDNRQYLSNSPMSAPYVPFDYYGEGFHYGTWIFWRFLTEQFTASAAGLPTLVRDVWRRLDGRSGALDEYSLQGLESVLAARGTGLTREVAFFADANRHPADSYDEGATYTTFPAQPDYERNPTPANPGPFTNSTGATLDHLSSSTTRYTPSVTMTTANWQLALQFNLPNDVTRPAAMVTRFRQDGGTITQRVVLDATGAGSLTVPFSVTTYKYVEITLVNASNRTTCWQQGSPFSCYGIPTDENQVASVTGTASQS